MSRPYLLMDEWTGGCVNAFATLAAAVVERDRLNHAEPGRYYIPDRVPEVLS